MSLSPMPGKLARWKPSRPPGGMLRSTPPRKAMVQAEVAGIDVPHLGEGGHGAVVGQGANRDDRRGGRTGRCPEGEPAAFALRCDDEKADLPDRENRGGNREQGGKDDVGPGDLDA